MSDKNQQSGSSGGIGMSGALFIVFLVLKLCNVIDWSWIWITSPLWIPLVFVVSVFLLVFICVVVSEAAAKLGSKK